MTAVRLYRTRNGNHDVYQLRWYANGSRRCQTIGKIKDLSKREAEARRREKEIAFAVGRERPSRPRRMTLERFLERDRQAIATDVRPATLDEYRFAAKHAIDTLGADTPLDRIDRKLGPMIRSEKVKGITTLCIDRKDTRQTAP